MPRPRDSELHRAIGARIRALRLSAALTQEQLAEAADLQPAAVSRIESGSLGFSLTSAMMLASALGVPMSQLFGSDVGSVGGLDPAERRVLTAWRRVPSRHRPTLLMLLERAADLPPEAELEPPARGPLRTVEER
jgi:transcriptional regulator with XRE-family HTH domain